MSYAEQHTFNNMDEFYTFLTEGHLQFSDPRLEEFYNLYSKINEGCNCSKRKRISRAKDSYYNMLQLNDEMTLMLKRSAPANKIIFKDGETLIGELV